MQITLKRLVAVMKKKGYPVDTGDRAVNLIGIRGTATGGDQSDDWLCVLHQINGKPVLETYSAMTDCEAYLAGQSTGQQLPAGHYQDCWELGVYMGRYASLVSCDALGLNLCHGEPDPYTLEAHQWSGATQVLKDITDFHVVLNLLFEAAAAHERTFSYTLLDEADFG